jgi:sugar phosphate isomerase/epimerase
MSYRIGIPTLLELNTIESTVELCNELNLKMIEISMTRPEFFPISLSPDKLINYSEKYGIEFSLHLPEEIDLATFHEPIREAYVNLILEMLTWANNSNIKIVNMHLSNGIYYTMPQGKIWLYDVYKDKFKSNILDSLNRIIQKSIKYDIKICIENCSNFNLSFIREIVDISQGTYLTWDVGHDAATGYKETEVILNHKNRIAHMHLHDNIDNIPHKELYTGDVKIDEMIKFAKSKDIGVIVEVKTVESLRKSILKLFSRI